MKYNIGDVMENNLGNDNVNKKGNESRGILNRNKIWNKMIAKFISVFSHTHSLVSFDLL